MIPSAPIVGQHYAFAHGRLGVLRQSLLGQSDVNRLVGSHDLREAEQILTELKFTASIDQSLRGADRIQAALAAWIRAETEAMVQPSKHDAFRALWITEDLPFLAYLLKQKAGLTSSISTEPSLLVSAFDPDAVRALVQDGVEGDLPEGLVALVARVRSLERPTPETIDALVAQFGADERLRLAKKSGSALIVRYVRHAIDAQNVRTALRLLRADEADPTSFLLKGGTIAPSKLEGSLDAIRAAIVASDLHFHVLKNLTDDIERPTALERGLSDLLADDVEQMWERTLGVEPPFAFAATSLAHLRLIRAIVMGKRNELSPQAIKHILPPYVASSRFSA